MDVTRLRSGELLAGASAVALLAVMFLDWFGGESAWASLSVLRVLLALMILLGLAIVVLTVTARPVAIPVAAAVVTIGVGAITTLPVAYRVLVDEPGDNAVVDLGAGAYAGLLLLVALVLGAWRTVADERTQTAASQRQTERVLAVRGTPRPPPPARSVVTPGGADPLAKPARRDAPPG